MKGGKPPTTMIDEVDKQVTFMSWNSTGFNNVKSLWLNNILSEKCVDFCSIQEHFKTESYSEKYFRKSFRNFSSFVLPALRPPGQDSGRASGGLVQLVRKEIGIKRDRVPTHNFRIQAQVLNLPSGRLLWINTYFPTDPQLVGEYDDTDLQELLAELESILNSSNYTDLVWGADLNWDMKRNTYFAKMVREFVDRLGLAPVWEHHPVDDTHVHTDNKSLSTLDHFLVSPRLIPLVGSCGVLHRGDNFSRHSPIWLTLNLGALPCKPMTLQSAPRRPAWSKATEIDISHFTSDMQARLEKLSLPPSLSCKDLHCSLAEHSQERDSLMLDILCNLVESSYTTLPMTGGRPVSSTAGRGSRGGLPGWNQEVEPYRQDSIYWHNVWLRESRPSNGWLHETMVRKRTLYHYAVRKLKRKVNLKRAEKLFEASMVGDVDLLKEMKKIKSGNGNHEELPDTVGGADDEEGIADKF